MRQRRARRRRRGLLHFFEALSLFLHVGFDLGYAWPETVRALGSELPSDLAAELLPRAGEGGSALLGRLGEDRDESARMWFSVLRELYAQGAGMQEAVRAVASQLRRERELELETHCRELPGRVNVLLLIFFLPPTLALLFVPLLQELQRSFSH